MTAQSPAITYEAPREYFVDADDAARFLKLKRRTLLQMARDGAIPAHPMGDVREKCGVFF